MSNEQRNKELFERVGKDALSWMAQAKQLKMSADGILPQLKEAFRILPTLPGAQERRFAFFHSYMLLVGLAFENLIKGILIGRNPALVDTEKLESESWVEGDMESLTEPERLSPFLLMNFGFLSAWRNIYSGRAGILCH